MKIDYDGRTWDFDFLDLTVDECEQIEKFTGCRGLGDWSVQLTVANTKAIQAAWWVIRRHAGEDPGPVARRDPSLRPVALSNAMAEAERAEEQARQAAEAEADADADPTLSARSSPAPSPPATLASVLQPSPPG